MIVIKHHITEKFTDKQKIVLISVGDVEIYRKNKILKIVVTTV